ncbi:MAG: DUF3310 domain-containing protein [Hyphomicrobiaceae bacterium]
MTHDAVNHPVHYQSESGLEAIDVIEAVTGLEMHLPTAMKYILRHQAKGRPAEDLAKAKWYIDRLLAKKGLPERQPVMAIDMQARVADVFRLEGAARTALFHVFGAIAAVSDDRRWAYLRNASDDLGRAIRALGGAEAVA